ncbi:MobF family relaxase [Lacipirellula limnantheis]|uniref:Multifunctional conjugation protein TraI n=1 Tax=Lacipirellula limnantheis TaxID=2528024 RepID=A0A517U6W6_9BACT|nr:MobF family relaxase [Lacipirellula limnantheis]QDT76364.1 Multifunctional conjugation protein TraI [Lacipirellula limnantheis]
MLSIGAMQSRQADYYQRLAREDYYLEGGEPPGSWLGGGAQALGHSGVVKPEDLAALFQGFAADGNRLVQNAGKENRQCGWDLTFSAPKSVSFLWSQADEATRHEYLAAQKEAVAAAIRYIEENFAVSRIGKAGAEHVDAQLVVAAFEHATSRALDPQLHTHCLVLNLGVDAAGNVRSLRSKPFYQQKMLAGAFYRCELSRQLQARLGVSVERPLTSRGKPAAWFEVQGVPKSILSQFSKRRAAIEQELGSRGMESASAAAFAALTTRETKTVVPPRKELYDRWKEEGTTLGFRPEGVYPAVRSPRRQDKDAAEQHQRYREALAAAVAELTCGENSFTKSELIRSTLIAAQEKQLPAASVTAAIEIDLAATPFFISLGIRNGEHRYTTEEVLADEQEFLRVAATLKVKPFQPVAEQHVAAAAAAWRGKPGKRFQLDSEQQEAVRYLAQGTESIKVVSGFAGAGKTDMLAAAKEALEQGGYRVIGTALAGVAARNLEESTGIQSETVRRREHQLAEPTFGEKWTHHARQIGRVALGKQTWSLPKLEIDSRTVLVIDEAGMLGTRDFTMLAKAVVAGGGSIIAVGDERQLSSIERGGGFQRLVEAVGGVRLTEIRRQTDVNDRQAVKDVVGANPEEALQHYAKKGQFFVGKHRADAERELVADWARNGGVERPGEHHIFAGTRAEVSRFNTLCQEARLAGGLLDAREKVELDGVTFMVGDRVRFDIAARTRGIQKGTSGAVIACREGFTGKYVTVALGDETTSWSEHARDLLKHHATQLLNAALGKPTTPPPPRHDVVLVPLESLNPLCKPYRGLSLDYARTTHLGQGQTVENSYVLLGGQMTDRELSYVQMSRHREKLHLYSSEQEAGKTLAGIARKRHEELADQGSPRAELPGYSTLAAQMRQSRAQELATSLTSISLPSLKEPLHAPEHEQTQRR